MRPSNKSRSRNKSSNSSQNQRRSVGNIINRVFDSAGPDGKVRGTPQQIIDKYNVLARDAQLSGDRVAAESFLQHAEHYSRLLGEAQRQVQEQRQAQEQRDQPRREETQHRRSNGHDTETTDDGDETALVTLDVGGSSDQAGPVETPEDREAKSANNDTRRSREPGPRIAPSENAENGSDATVAKPSDPEPQETTETATEAPVIAETVTPADQENEAPAPKKRTRRRTKAKAAEEETASKAAASPDSSGTVDDSVAAEKSARPPEQSTATAE
ncbi:MAG: DUF4167 domain-containing protein [Pseudomonadota bacterium]